MWRKLIIFSLLFPVTAFGTITVTDRGTGANNSSEASTTMQPASTIAAGSLGVLCVAGDNANAATKNFPATFNDSAGNTWIARQYTAPGGAANSSVEQAIYTARMNTQLTSGGSITFTYLAVNTVAKAWTLSEVAPTAGNLCLYVNAAQGTVSNTATPSINTQNVSTNGVVIGTGGAESADTWTGVAGWSTQQHNGAGSGITGMSITSQSKAGAGVLVTYNPTLTIADTGLVWISIYEVNDKVRAISQPTFTATATIVITPLINSAVGSMGVLCVANDNIITGGATPSCPSTFNDSVGNTWTRRTDVIQDPGAGGAGAENAIYTAPITTALTTADNLTITWDGATNVSGKAAILYEFAPLAAGTMTYIADGGVGAKGATGALTITTSSITNGDYVIGAGALEDADTWVADGDTTNGTWKQMASAGNGTVQTSSMSVTSQYKLVTATATQTYNPTSSAFDSAINWVQIREVSTGPTTAQKAAFFMLFP